MKDCHFFQSLNRKRKAAVFVMLILLVVMLMMAGLFLGSVGVEAEDIIRMLFGGDAGQKSRTIIFTIRLPRVIAAAVSGGALALAGFLLQTYFNNPIAGPFVLGISSGAKLAVAMVMIVSFSGGVALTSFSLILAAFLGALGTVGFILLISERSRSGAVLIVCGVMIGYICSAITDIAVTFADDSDIINLHNWSRGSLSGISMENVAVMVPLILVAFALSFLESKNLGAYQQGEAFAKSVGVDVRRFSVAIILLASILSAVVTAFAGPISFLGVAVPHIMRKLMGTLKPIYMIPACFLGGACFCLLSDIIARTLMSPAEISISTVTAVFGAPVVIFLMIQNTAKRRGYGS